MLQSTPLRGPMALSAHSHHTADNAIKLFLSSSLYELHDRDTYQRSLSSMKFICIDMAFITMKNMILLPGIYLTQS
ncbi:S2-RNase [Pyrus ussuriensis x Pyrus communis]|uniref:S2-RNase n=1 Tax=Pyrus ussuriensis x Pyrus communis TaxID=2448454 RepID=A0A5N5FBC5_9ROSA|nr:S2-RNase [Pyrus ussuriensis x Pyrus communis]